MNNIKNFFIFLALWISGSIYWAYYFSNIANISTKVEVPKDEILKEKQLFAKYRINEEAKSWSWNEKSNEKVQIFKKEAPELKILRTSFDKNKNLKPDAKIIISFEEEINIYSLLWFKKVLNWEYLCNWKKIKSNKKAERCESENKLFITKKWENNTIFKWVVKKSEVDKKTLILSTNLEELQNYELKISQWVKWFKSTEWVFPVTKKDFSYDFSTTDKEWNIKKEEENKESWTWKLANSWIWEGLKAEDQTKIIEEKSEEEKQKETEEWLKKKQEEVWKQETKWLEKSNKTWTWEKIETGSWEISKTWTWEEVKTWSWETSETWTWEEADK